MLDDFVEIPALQKVTLENGQLRQEKTKIRMRKKDPQIIEWLSDVRLEGNKLVQTVQKVTMVDGFVIGVEEREEEAQRRP
jgi:hypothetical protein